MAEDFMDGSGSTRIIGGPGHIVEIDESKFSERRNNRGIRVVGKWILSGYNRTRYECFLVECSHNKRDRHTLLCLIKDRVEPGATILTDCWRAYNALPQHDYTHLTVIHQ